MLVNEPDLLFNELLIKEIIAMNFIDQLKLQHELQNYIFILVNTQKWACAFASEPDRFNLTYGNDSRLCKIGENSFSNCKNMERFEIVFEYC